MAVRFTWLAAAIVPIAVAGFQASPSPGEAQGGQLTRNVTEPVVKTGLEVLLSSPEHLELLDGKNVGLIVNPTSVDSKLTSTIDLLHEHPSINLVRLFAPEHGVRGEAYAGEYVGNYTDERTGLPVQSLYGRTRRPPAESLEDVDIMVYDIQDVGSRSYTYIYTMAYAMEECGKLDIPFVVLDRPNPCGADIVSGNILDPEEHQTFVGLYAIPYQYGMTPGETAMLFNKEFNDPEVELTVVPMEGYERHMMQWDTGLPFVPTSTHIPDAKHAVYYNLTGIIGEIRNTVSIGVGYTLPFETIAAPWIDPYAFADALTAKEIPGLMFRPISYRPSYASFEGEMIHGVHIIITDYRAVRPFEAQIHFMEVIQSLFPESEIFTDAKAGPFLFDEVLGTDSIREQVLAGATAEEIIASYQEDVEAFMPVREQYLLY